MESDALPTSDSGLTDPSPADSGPSDGAEAGELVVAGLGASAGGLEAFEAFFAGLPEVDGVAFVVVLHLAPDEESRLADILQGDLPLPVTQVTERVRIEAGHVYVIPPNKNLLAADGWLVLEPIEEERVRRRPIDHFFRTLAGAYGERSVGVILSGTGANGTVGVRALKEAGGLILAQDPSDATFDEMPRSAIASGVVDKVGPAGALAAEVVAYAHRLRDVHLPEAPSELPEDGAKALNGVLAQLRARTGHDFAYYKRATVLRRLDRRLHVTGAASLGAYLDVLRGNAGEAAALLDDLLISVTNFFRDPDAFAALEAAVPRLFEGKGPDDAVRVWVAGCATGEEAYSVAMLLLEHASGLSGPPGVQVFATDLSETSVHVARQGAYPESIEADVSPERLRRFFAHENGRYRVSAALREAVLFAPHSLLADPPFSRLDLVSCRNLLIYLQRDLQQQVLSLFHYALRPRGLLFLGTSETIGGGPRLFGAVDKGARLYRRRDAETPPPALPSVPRVLARPPRVPTTEGSALKRTPDPAPPSEVERVHRALREETAPPSVLVGEADDVVHVSDGAVPFLQVTPGAPTRGLLPMLRPELRAAAQSALFQARRAGGDAEAGPVAVPLDGGLHRVRVRARPAPADDLVQVVFEVLPPDLELDPATVPTDGEALALSHEHLRQTQEQLRVSVEEFETSREELRAQNEELQSINEELRSTAEELETSKEEAQSMAEELRTVNDEMRAKVDETAQAKGDLENLIASTEIATLFLDRDLRIQRFTPSVRDLFHVLASDLGRPIADLTPRFGEARLVEDAETVLARLGVQEREVRSEGGRWYLVHVRPYRSTENRIDGVVVTFIDITRRKADELALRASADRSAFRAALADAFRPLSDPVALQAEAARLLGEHLNSSRVHYAEVDAEVAVGTVEADYHPGVPSVVGQHRLDDYGPAVMDEVRAGRTLVVPDVAGDRRLTGPEREATAGLQIGAYVMVPLSKGGRTRAVLVAHHAGPHAWTEAEVALVEETAERTWAVVEQARAEAALRAGEERLRTILEHVPAAVIFADADGALTYANPEVEAILGRPFIESPDVDGYTEWPLFVPGTDEPFPLGRIPLARTLTQGETVTGEVIDIRRPDGTTRAVSVNSTPVLDADGAVRYGIAAFVDITERREAEDALRHSEARFRQLAETVPDIVFTAAPDGTVDYVNPHLEELTGRPPADVVGTAMWPALVHPDDRERTEAAWAEAVERREPFEVRHRLVTDDGPCWCITHARPIHGAHARVAAWFGTVTDVDALVRSEDEVRQLNATLEARVAARTDQVRQLSARLSAAEQDERRRIAHVLHDDLQQRLAGLAIMHQILWRSSEPDKVQALQAKADEVLDGAAALTRTLASELAPSVLASEDFADVLRWLAEVKRRDHRLEVDVEVDGPCRVPDGGVRGLLYHALRELLFNIVKHAGTGRAVIRAHRDGPDVVVEVEDFGGGLDPTGVAQRGGGGFGLSSVRERIERVGGRLTVDSAPGAGTLVTLTAPAGSATG